MTDLTPASCRILRENLKWSADDLASMAEVAPRTVELFESGASDQVELAAKARMAAALSDAGIRIPPAPQPKSESLSPEECRAWRALNGWSADELAKKANLPANTIAKFENRMAELSSAAKAAVIKALRSDGMEKPPVTAEPDMPATVRWTLIFIAGWAALIMVLFWRNG